MTNNINDYSYPNIEPIEYIDKSLDKIKARDDASKCSFRRLSTFPVVSEDDIGMKVYLAGVGNFQLLAVSPEPTWKQLTSDDRNPAYVDWVTQNYQPISAVLTSLARLVNVSNAFPYFDGPTEIQTAPLTPLGAQLLGQANQADMREALGLGSASTLDTPIDGSYIQPGSISIDKIDNNFQKNLGWSTGDVKLTYKRVADSGWIMLNDGSIGSASSGATTRANSDTYDLYQLMWEIPLCTVQTFAGVDTTKGNSAIQDWSANKRLVLPKVLGRALGIAGSGDGLTTRELGQASGQEKITLGLANMPKHNHGLDTYLSVIGSKKGVYNCNIVGNTRSSHGWGFSQNTRVGEQSIYNDGEGATEGAGAAFDNLQPTSFLNIMMKL